MHNTIVYPGSFDPITYGHIDIISRAANLFTNIIVAVATNSGKSTLLPLAKRLELTTNALISHDNVIVKELSGLLVDFMAAQNSKLILRGVRTTTDFEYEFQLAGMNRLLNKELDVIFLMPSEQYSCIASSLVCEVASLGGNLAPFVPPAVALALRNSYCSGNKCNGT